MGIYTNNSILLLYMKIHCIINLKSGPCAVVFSWDFQGNTIYMVRLYEYNNNNISIIIIY